jgi:tripartite-type tricarboxylate transporter receptor subunit TctC
MKKWFNACLLAATALLPAVASAQYPAKLVTIVVPFTPGASNDAIGRYLAEQLGKRWKQNVIVENRPGAGSSIGAAYVAKSPADGHTLLVASSSYATNAATRSDHGFDPVKDLKAISIVGRGQIGVITGSRVPMASLADLAREAKGRTLYYATAGVGSSQHFNAELLSDAMGIRMEAVPYRGSNEGLLDLAAGRIDVVVGGVGGLLPHIKSGKARPIATLGKARTPSLPDVPTSAEQGFPAAVTENYWVIMVPASTPDNVVQMINEGVSAATHTPEGRAFLAKLDGEPAQASPQEVAAGVRQEITYWSGLARRLNIADK